MALLPPYQCRGIGAKLVRAGLETCRKHDVGFVVVLGHPDYYPRFGFRRASRFGFANEYGADDAFMAVELRAGSIPSEGGLIRYSAAFTAVDT